jgi:hypothetical protein
MKNAIKLENNDFYFELEKEGENLNFDEMIRKIEEYTIKSLSEERAEEGLERKLKNGINVKDLVESLIRVNS